MSVRNYWLDYGHRLRVTRIVLGISENEAAAAHGVTLATYRKWEDGRPPRSCKSYLVFAAKYDVNLDWLIAGEAAYIGSHLSKLAPGKVALLPNGGRIIQPAAFARTVRSPLSNACPEGSVANTPQVSSKSVIGLASREMLRQSARSSSRNIQAAPAIQRRPVRQRHKNCVFEFISKEKSALQPLSQSAEFTEE